MYLLIDSELEHFYITFAKKSVLLPSQMRVEPQEAQADVFTFLEGKQLGQLTIAGGFATPEHVKSVFTEYGYKVQTSDDYQKILSKERKERDEINQQPAMIDGQELADITY